MFFQGTTWRPSSIWTGHLLRCVGIPVDYDVEPIFVVSALYDAVGHQPAILLDGCVQEAPADEMFDVKDRILGIELGLVLG